MLKRFLFSVAMLSVCATSAFAQDVFIAFEQGAAIGVDGARNTDGTIDAADAPGTAFVFVNSTRGIGALDFDITVADDSVVSITGVNILNSGQQLPGTPEGGLGVRFDVNPDTGEQESVTEFTSTSARLFATSIRGTSNGINTGFFTLDSDADVAGSAFLLGTVDFDLVSNGVADFEISGTSADNAFTSFDATFQGGSVTVTGVSGNAVPEPSTMGILALGLVGFVARRRR